MFGRLFFLVIVVVLVGLSCSSEKLALDPPPNTKNFDLPGFFQQEVSRLANTNLQKTVISGKRPQTRILDSVEYELELGSFFGFNINHPSLSDKYIVDTIINSNSKFQINYKAKDNSVKMSSLMILKNKEVIEEIIIRKLTNSFIYNSDQLLTYQPNSGFSIITRQKVVFFEETSTSIQSKFLD